MGNSCRVLIAVCFSSISISSIGQAVGDAPKPAQSHGQLEEIVKENEKAEQKIAHSAFRARKGRESGKKRQGRVRDHGSDAR